MMTHSAGNDASLYDRLRAVIDWFEKVPARVREPDNTLVGHYVKAADWRVIRSELNSIANATRVTPPEKGDDDA